MRRSKRTQHRTKRPQHRPKRTFEGQKGQNEVVQDKRAGGAPFWLCAFPWARVESRVDHARVAKQISHKQISRNIHIDGSYIHTNARYSESYFSLGDFSPKNNNNNNRCF